MTILNMNLKDLKILDCTLRDGGYYNNWNFNNKFINNYLKLMSKIGVNLVEIGFRSLRDDRVMGNTAYSTNQFLSSLKIPNNLKIGVMVNASDFFDGKLNFKEKLKKYFYNVKSYKIYFIRLACHFREIEKIIPIIKWLKKKNIVVTINLMQISEIKSAKINIKKIFSKFEKAGVDVLYLADSLGCMTQKNVKDIFKLFKKNWKKPMGFHPHDNLNMQK